MSVNILDALGAMFPEGEEGKGYQCDQCEKANGSIKLMCSCGFKVEACAKCYPTNRSEVLSALGEHAGDCEGGRHLLRCLA